MRKLRRRLRRRITEAVVALVVVVGGVGIAAAGIAGPAPRQSEHRDLTRIESQFADMHQNLQLHRACTETGRWDEWPCDRFSPAERP